MEVLLCVRIRNSVHCLDNKALPVLIVFLDVRWCRMAVEHVASLERRRLGRI